MEHRQDDVNGSECVSSQCFHQGGFCCLCLGSCALDLVPRFFLAILHMNTALFNERGREERKYQILLGTECQVHFRPHELQEQPCELAVSPHSLDHNEHKNTLENSLEDDDTAVITFPYFTTGTQKVFKKKSPRKNTKGRNCATLMVTTKHLPVTVFCYDNTLQELSYFLPWDCSKGV